jgi:mannose-6-phosphate isomerase-like protein (cupin superfamily)
MMPDSETIDAAVFGTLASSLEPLQAPADLRARLLASVTGPAKYLPFCAELAAHFDLSGPRMKELLSQIDEPGRWTAGIEPIQGFLHFPPGARHEGLHGGFVRMRRGTLFPLHRHRQRELMYVLEGAVMDDQGRRLGPGGAFEMPAGSSHSLTVPGEDDVLIALLHGGIEMLGG